MKKILLVDDDEKYRYLIEELLISEGYQITSVGDPVIALDKFKETSYDLVISDLIMGVVDGLQLVSLIKRIDDEVPIIILTGYQNDQKEIAGFDLDIDDYIYKPVSMEVLLKRINARLKSRKIAKSVAELYSKKDNIVINLKERKVYQNNERVVLTAKEYDILVFFLAHKNQVFSREEIIKSVWFNNTHDIDSRTIDTHIKKIRNKMAISSISSVRGVGYEWFE